MPSLLLSMLANELMIRWPYQYWPQLCQCVTGSHSKDSFKSQLEWESQKESRNVCSWWNVVFWCFLRTKFEISCSAPRDCSFGFFVKLDVSNSVSCSCLSLQECFYCSVAQQSCIERYSDCTGYVSEITLVIIA